MHTLPLLPLDVATLAPLDGKKLLITGGARGLGEGFVRAAAARGAQVTIADIAAQAGEALAAQLHGDGFAVSFVRVDLSDPASVEAAAQAAGERMGGIDGLVNNGAITNSGGKIASELSIETWDAVMNVNVRGTWLMTMAALPFLRASGQGRVVNIASDTALWGAPRLLAYTASKGAVMSMTRSLARELGSYGITVNAVAPGLVEVEATAYVPAERHRHYLEGRALPRAQVPDDVIGPVLFLLSDASRFVTGQVLPVNGGFVMP
ncbi:short-chain dehydrogenase [Pandoraea faecigallinarum]|uniref:Short-chain dehydrogenase n=1 Tax=Pandoraea faecigallinarum TaxID=656179 RepID=A0A0H3WYX9_9BURK|nr:SDR family oxidoreductase [Pandoraea faecigallinarum]AKM32937.1 short-chain dehydrogenase [Pandoraea faecigallinarum]